MIAVSTKRMIQTRFGETIGRICVVHRRNDRGVWHYQGSYFERILVVPPERVADCRNHGINYHYLRQRERAEKDEPREYVSPLASFT